MFRRDGGVRATRQGLENVIRIRRFTAMSILVCYRLLDFTHDLTH